MRIIDSNLIIYYAKPEFGWLKNEIFGEKTYVSIITKLEVLGFNRLSGTEKVIFDHYFDSILQLPITDLIVEKAINLRQRKKMGIADSVIAATALEFNLELFTHNITDFDWISGLKLVDPIANS
jgi:toxin FitB